MKNNFFKVKSVIIFIIAIWCGIASGQSEAWEVSTFSYARANGDIYVADNSDLYIADFGNPALGNGSTVVKITPDGVATTFATGLTAAPSGIIMNSSGDLFIATLNGGDIYEIAPNGDKTTVLSGLSGPVGLAMDDEDNLYVAECFTNRVSKVVNGTTETVAVVSGFGCANGLVWGHDAALYVLMWQNGQIYRVDLAGNASLFATIPGGGGHLELYGNYYYALSRTGHALYRIDFNGGVELFAGTGVDGNEDGPATEATISRPNGIGVDRNNGEFYITGSSDFNLDAIPIRKVAPVATDNEFEINPGLAGSWFYPNQDGQGFVLDFAVGNDRFDAVLYWFTYNDQPADSATELDGFGSRQSRWFVGSGQVDGASVEMPIYLTSGGIFNDPTSVNTEQVGSMTLEFSSCFSGVLNFEFTVPEVRSGVIELVRLTPDIWCETWQQNALADD